MAFERVAHIDDLPSGRGLCVEVRGIDIGLFRVGDQIYAMENRCPHAGYPLSEGELKGCVIVCPEHGWDFDLRTGFKPGGGDGFPIPCFAVELRGEEIWLDLDEPINRPPRRRA